MVAAAVLLMTLGATLAPWVARNTIVMGKMGLSTAFEYNLCLGNAPGARWDSGSRISELESPELKARVARLNEADAARVYREVAIKQIQAQPGRFLALSLGKAINFWRLYPKPAARSVSLVEKLVGLMTYGPILVLACLWIVANRRGSGPVWLLLSYPITAMLLAAVTVSVDRYRLPFDLYLIIIASAAVGTWLDRRNPQSAK